MGLALGRLAVSMGAMLVLANVSASAPKVFVGEWELSGCDLVSDGLLVADDELVGSVLFVSSKDLAAADGKLPARIAKVGRKWEDCEPMTPAKKLLAVQDVEGIATDQANRVFLLGSHHAKERKPKGEDFPQMVRRIDREFLLECRWDAKDAELVLVREAPASGDLIVRSLFAAGVPVTMSVRFATVEWNAEGLALDSASNRLFVGLRAPLDGDNALLLEGPVDDFFSPARRALLTVHRVPLGGGGIRSLHRDTVTGRLLIVSGAAGEGAFPPALWSWAEGAAPQQVMALSGPGFGPGNPEGICRDPAGRLVVTWDVETGENPAIQVLDVPDAP